MSLYNSESGENGIRNVGVAVMHGGEGFRREWEHPPLQSEQKENAV